MRFFLTSIPGELPKKYDFMKITFAPQALNDLKRLYQFIEDQNPRALKRAAVQLKSAFHILQKHPQAGYQLDHLHPFRELLVPFGNGNYVIRYRIEKQTIHIVHLWHSREDRC